MKTEPSLSTPRFIEPARELEVIDDADVVVVGAGAGGVGAAISAARHGARVILIERFGTLGGTWTTGLLSAIMVNWTARGIFEEFRRKLDARGAWKIIPESWPIWGGDQPPEDSASHEGSYDTETAKVVLDEMVAQAGVTVYYFAQVAHVFKSEDGKHITGLVIQSKEGRHVITGKIFIDSSGDGDVSALAGVPFDSGREADQLQQPMTMIFTMEGVDSDRAHQYIRGKGGDPECRRAWALAKSRGEVTVPRDFLILNPAPKPGKWQFNCTRLLGYDGTKLKDVSAATTKARQQVAEIVAFMRKYIPGFENAMLSETAAHIGVRETRRIKCDYTVTADDIHQRTRFPDAIARGNWPIDIHSPTGDSIEVTPLKSPAWYEVPYRSTTARGMENLLVASRCIDATHEAHAGIRASPQVCAIGEGVGAAAAHAIARKLTSVRDVDIQEVRTSLRKSGALV